MARLPTVMCVALSIPALAQASVVVGINPPFSDPPFLVSAGYSVSYSPTNGINLTTQNPAVPFPNTGQYNDNKWGVSGPGIGGTSWGPVIGADYGGENAPELAITVSGFKAGSFDIYARIFTNYAPISPTDYGARLGLTSGGLTSYLSSSGGTLLDTGDTPYEIREFLLGTVNDEMGTLTVYLDDFDGASIATAVFAGLRIEESPGTGSVPEPSTSLVAVVAGAVLVAGRRRFRGRRN